MSGVTDNYGLITVVEGEAYDEEVFNTNNRTIDAQMKVNAKRDKTIAFFNQSQPFTSNIVVSCGPLNLDTSASVTSQITGGQTFASVGSGDGLIKFNEPGIYSIMWWTYPNSEPGNAGYRILMNGAWPGPPTAFESIVGQGIHMANQTQLETVVPVSFVRVPTAGLELKFQGVQINTTQNVNRIRIAQIGKF